MSWDRVCIMICGAFGILGISQFGLFGQIILVVIGATWMNMYYDKIHKDTSKRKVK